jgi:hypothetical protein
VGDDDSNDSDSSRDDDYFSSLSESALSILMENHAIVDEEGKDCCFHAMSPREELIGMCYTYRVYIPFGSLANQLMTHSLRSYIIVPRTTGMASRGTHVEPT